jgi:5-methylthioadenosine/S-adenosylhomocysteine deaminase
MVGADWQPADVFHMATQGGAAAMGMADCLGSLTAGKLADIVLIDAARPHLVPLVNPVGTLVHTGQGRDVDTVIVGGEIVVEGGRLVHADMATICAEAAAAARQLWEAAAAP